MSDQSAVMRVGNGGEEHAGEEDQQRVREEVCIDDENRADDDVQRAGNALAVDHVDGTDRSEEQAEEESHARWPIVIGALDLASRQTYGPRMKKICVLFTVVVASALPILAGEA